MSGDPEQDYFSDGITEDIITVLSRLHWFFVIARNSTFAYKGKPVDVKHLGRELGRSLRFRGQRPEERSAGPHYQPAHRRDDEQPHMGGAIRPRAQ